MGKSPAGELLFNGRDLRRMNEDEMRQVRGRDISMIFQDPMTSLNPVFSIEQQMVDAILAHPPKDQPISRSEARERAVHMLNRVGIPDAAQRIQKFSSPVFGRNAPAYHDRLGAAIQSVAADRR